MFPTGHSAQVIRKHQIFYRCECECECLSVSPACGPRSYRTKR